jgi:tetratricopeptide (TPR) repeat protein
MFANARRILLVALIACPVSGCTRGGQSEFDRGEQLLEQRDYQGALAAYEAAARQEPASPRTMRQLGMAHAALGHRTAAIKYLEVWALARPADTTGRITLGQLYLADGRADDALGQANAVLKDAPASRSALMLAGSAYAAKKDSAKAMATYRQVAQLSPKDATTQYLAGVGMVTAGRSSEALVQFESALALNPAYFAALEQIAGIDIAANRSDAAVTRVKKQIGIVGDSVALKEILARAHAAHGDRDLAASDLLDIIARAPTYLAPYVRLSDLYRTWGKYDQALDILARAAKVDPKNRDLRLVEGTTYEAKGDRAGAIRAYEAALAIDPRFSVAGNNLAMLLAESGENLDKALQVIIAASAADPANPAIGDTFGWVLFKRGDYARALAVFKDVVTKLPNEPTVAYHIGLTESRTGDVPAARHDLQRAVASPTKFPERDAAQKALSALK